jgi:hypothetical protein
MLEGMPGEEFLTVAMLARHFGDAANTNLPIKAESQREIRDSGATGRR